MCFGVVFAEAQYALAVSTTVREASSEADTKAAVADACALFGYRF